MTAALLAGLAVWWWQFPSGRRRILPRSTDVSQRLSPAVVAAALTPVVGFVLIGTVGLLVGLAVTPVVHRVVAGLRSSSVIRRQRELASQAPWAIDLVVAVLGSGRDPLSSLLVVSDHVPDPVSAQLRLLARRIDGQPPGEFRDGGVLAPVGRAVARAAEAGLAVAPTVALAAEELRRDRRAVQRQAAQRIAVRTTMPLGLCFLPAFFLVGIFPTIADVVLSFRW